MNDLFAVRKRERKTNIGIHVNDYITNKLKMKLPFQNHSMNKEFPRNKILFLTTLI